MELVLIITFSYLCGSIPYGLILTKLFAKRDIRNIGSGNIGATNVLRSGNKILAILTLALDVIKGFLPVYVTLKYFSDYSQLSALIVFLGHVFPVWLKFKGGKGVATYLGILFALSLSLAFLFIFTWVIVLMIFKYSSLSSIFSTFSVMIINFLKFNTIQILKPTTEVNADINLLLFILLILIIFTHKKNILNLKNKSENKIKI
jgi:acyl phosphate:glycerol-3-phosphate acyltransferase